jgi:HrpA-like RNA helicase
MSNHGGGRAHFDRVVRYRPPNPNTKPNLSLPARPRKHSLSHNYPFNPGQDLSTILKRFGAPSSRIAPPPLKNDKTPQELPVFKKKDEIVKTVLASPVTIIQAETGSGKTTLVPQFLQEAGLKVTILGPRRLPASEVARFGAKMRNEELGDSIGFRHALDKAVSDKTQIVYATEGYELARQLHNPMSPDEVLIFDEFHERTANAQLLLAHLRMREADGFPIPKIIIMSATLDSKRVSDYFGDVPVIKVEGRRFEVKELPKGKSAEADAVRFLNEGINPLSFHYGARDIEEYIKAVRQHAPEGASIYPLHSKLPREQQREAIEPKKNKAVAATNTAQTSVTLDGMGAVIVKGQIRRLVLDGEGIPSLIIDDISQDEYTQQIGRVGRTGPGVFVSHTKPFNELKPHAPSEIQSIPLETLILRLEAGGIGFKKVNRFLFDHVKENNIELGYSTLHNLGLAGPERHITNLGRRVAQLPVDARMGKLIVKALDYQKEHGAEILDDAIRIAAIVEAEGILTGEKNWNRLAPGERSSDLKKQSIVYHRALGLTPEQREVYGIDEINFLRASDIETMIRRRMGLSDKAPSYVPVSGNETPEETQKRTAREALCKKWLSRTIIEAYADSVFRFIRRNEAGDYLYKPLIGEHIAVLQKESVVGGEKLITGSRLNIGYLDGNGVQKIQPLLLNAHRIDDLEWLEHKTPGHLAWGYKDGISLALRPSQKKQKGMISRDFRGGKSTRNGKNQNFRR